MDILLEQALKDVNKYRRKNFLRKLDIWQAYQQAKSYGLGWAKGGEIWDYNKQHSYWRPTNPSVACVKLPRGRYGFLFAKPLGWDATHWFGPWTDNFLQVSAWLELLKKDPQELLEGRDWIILSRTRVGSMELEERLTRFRTNSEPERSF